MSCVNGKEFVVTWHIENYSFCSHEVGEVIESPLFKTECLGGSKWKLHLVPRDLSEEKEVTQCFLKRCDKKDEICIQYKIEMIDPNGKILETAGSKCEKFRASYDSDSTLEIERTKLGIQQWNKNTLTLRCRMRGNEQSIQQAIGCEVRTKIGTESHSFHWEINLPLVGTARKEFLILENTKLKAELSKSGMTCDEFIVIKMSKIEMEKPLQRLVCSKISLLDAVGNVIKCKNGTHFFKSKTDDHDWEFPSFLTYFDFEKHSNESRKVALQFEFSTTNGLQSEMPPNFLHSADADNLLALQNDMRELFLSKKHTDVELKLEENTTITAHRSVLIARSAFFSKMFDHPDMEESKTGAVNVEEDKNTMHALLEYLYTGTVENMDCDTAKSLIIAADKYQLPLLVDKCVTYLINVFTVANVCEILKYANVINHQQLKTAALDYISDNIEEIRLLPEWAMIAENNELLQAVLSTVLEKFDMVPKRTLE